MRLNRVAGRRPAEGKPGQDAPRTDAHRRRGGGRTRGAGAGAARLVPYGRPGGQFSMSQRKTGPSSRREDEGGAGERRLETGRRWLCEAVGATS